MLFTRHLFSCTNKEQLQLQCNFWIRCVKTNMKFSKSVFLFSVSIAPIPKAITTVCSLPRSLRWCFILISHYFPHPLFWPILSALDYILPFSVLILVYVLSKQALFYCPSNFSLWWFSSCLSNTLFKDFYYIHCI